MCEKAFTSNASQAKEIIALAERKGLLLAEAMWVRYMPMTAKLKEVIKSGIIGDIQAVTANLNFPMMHKERLVSPELAGGALLDVGIYPVTFASIVLGNDIKEIKAAAVLTPEGVDRIGSYTFIYNNGCIADLNSGMSGFSDGKGVVYGEKGFIEVAGINNFISIKVFDNQHNLITQYDREEQITGYEYEVISCINAIKNKKIQCHEMPHSETIIIMEQMDEIRKEMGVIYPFEI